MKGFLSRYENILRGVETDSRKSAHLIEIFASPSEIIAGICEFTCAGLANGEAVIIIARENHIEDVHRQLGFLGFDFESMTASGQLVMLDAEETMSKFMVSGTLDPKLFFELVGNLLTSKAAGFPQIRAYGEMVDILAVDDKFDQAIELEKLWNEVAKRHAFTLLCGYSKINFSADRTGQRLKEVCGCHTDFVQETAV